MALKRRRVAVNSASSAGNSEAGGADGVEAGRALGATSRAVLVGDRGKWDVVESQGHFHDENSKNFLIGPLQNTKGRELRTVLERRAYSP